MAKYIAMEGCDWTGKSTQMEMLQNYLVTFHSNKKVLLIRQPGFTSTGLAIRRILATTPHLSAIVKRLLYAADHIQLMTEASESFKDYDLVLSDRSTFISDQVYSKAVSGRAYEVTMQLQALFPDIPCEDSLLIVLTAPLEVLKERARASREEEWAEDRDWDFLDKVSTIYRTMDFNHKKFKNTYFADASQDSDTVHKSILEVMGFFKIIE